MSQQDKTFSLEIREDKIGVLTMDVPGETMNTLRAEFADEISDLMKEIKSNSDLQGLVLISGKKDSFVAGADVTMIDACETAADAEQLSLEGHRVMGELESLNIPVVAAIHGPCLGGGLELALACHIRVCTESTKTVLGVPEVMLGLLPGSGGTQRLPRLIGVAKSLDLMLTGKQVRGKQALKMGLVDDVVPETVLLEVAVKLAKKGKIQRHLKRDLTSKLLETNKIGRNIMFDQAKKQTLSKTRGNYPAPEAILEVVKVGQEKGFEAGLKLEAKRFAELAMTSESASLRGIFFATTEMKKEDGVEGVAPKKVKKAIVLGGGLMGGGIANVTATKAKVPVRIKDIAPQGLLNAQKYTYDILNKKVKRRFMSKADMQSQLAMITGTTEYTGVKSADIVVEAVFEDLKLKHKMVADIEANCNENTIFASNTSSLPITQIASEAKRPENVIGLHYFSPVDKMPLAEIITHEGTSDQTISTTVEFARKQGKTPIVVKDGAGFYVNRILAPYMNEAARIILEQEPIEAVDKALVNFGFPVGPVTLLDEVGIDVGAKIGPILTKELGSRFEAPAAFDKLLADDRKGRKNEKGFYLYGKKAKKGKKQVDESIYKLFNLKPEAKMDPKALAERAVLLMLNEAARCLDEGILRSARDGDIGAIFGIGFPPFLGGPFHYMDSIGIAELVDKLERHQDKYGERFAPCESLIAMAKEDKKFYN
ncbi:Fatty oxidation complex, alpha subunit [Moritella viscosa]|uniref:enoyl-CoA hydratase n=1 Tax=Moritella viscosa TaxID=80854 RepID=A0A090IHE4_9GAMM|nr:fatty acid oxidation complex subunit alpha FadJ [Moritella viscosa]CED59379.1 fatty acid oxidation complex alpha subunit [Moritella viscosa]SGY87327.1 Fatty oxidation complex, alpha subunit [Moritella viscosa]SGY87352.1 Fatty oxidation complex, alpha subunit [Moritella viscosa]SGY88889.1 Fatty oxidation complex, alpha subunit [Moritella viscosa]SHO00480.1 Fatty oxidation complex, alpha subunit [Moritella viscosa]